MISKSGELMKAKRKERKDKGWVKCEVYAHPDEKERLSKYVNSKNFDGEYMPKVKKESEE